MSSPVPGEFDPDEAPAKWSAGADEEHEKKGNKPPKGKKEKKAKKGKHDRANPDFEDVAGYEGSAFKGSKEAKPPKTSNPPGEAPAMKFTEVKTLDKDECQKALEKYADSQLCWGTKPAKEMKITSCKGVTAFHYKLETFAENRSTKKKKIPYKGGKVDGPDNGSAPKPWEIDCKPKKMFSDDKVKKEVPHTAKVKKCKDCKGRGWEPCDDCDGWGKVECDDCGGEGTRVVDGAEGPVEISCPEEKMCFDCGGDGRVTCEDCEGYKKLKCFIQLKVKFINHDDEYILETTDLPDELIAKVGGTSLFEETAPVVHPIQNFPVNEINTQSKKMIDSHTGKWPNEFIHGQRQTLRGVPVTECEYKWEDGKYRFWVYGNEKAIYAPDYPQQCCCGCSIV